MSNPQSYPLSPNQKNTLLFRIAAGISLTGLCWFAWFNRISIDDMFFFARGRDVGIISAVTEQYNHYSGRFTAYFLNGVVLKYCNHWQLALWNVISILCFFAALRFVWKCMGFLPQVKKAGWIFLCAAILYGAVHPGEEFFWYTQVNTYLWTVTSLLFITGICLRTPTTGNAILLIICSFFAGGASESIVVPFLLLFTGYTIYSWRKTIRSKKIARILTLLILTITLYINISAPGNTLRAETLAAQHDMSFINAFIHVIYHYVASPDALYSYIWLAPLLVVTALLLKKPLFPFTLLQISIGYGILLLLFMAPGVWVLREPLPARALIACDVLSLAYALTVLQWLFQRLGKNETWTLITGNVMLFTIISIHAVNAYNYARAYDERDTNLRKSYTYKWLIQPLPDCRMYKNASVTPANRPFAAEHMLLYYNLKLH